ncbi:MAG: hydrogenase formation protein HypD [Promethearchaeota archaeon]
MFRFTDKKLNDRVIAQKLVSKITAITSKHDGLIRIMHVCGTHEHAIAESGLRSLLPENLEVISGPGCPVCVCATKDIFKALLLAESGHVVATFGDMLRVPSGKGSLQDARGKGADIRVVYSIENAISIARENPEKEVVFFAVGFETFVPIVAAAIMSDVPDNFSFLCSLKTIPSIMELLLSVGNIQIDGFLTPGHVSVIIGTEPYDLFATSYKMPIVTAGFQPNDILLALLMLVRQIQDGEPRNENEYTGVVQREGNIKAQETIQAVFEEGTVHWRGVGRVPKGGYIIKKEFEEKDANVRFDLERRLKDDEKYLQEKDVPPGCSCHLVITGQVKPQACPLFKSGRCNPQNPIGPCMVSDEGTCRIAFLYDKD